MTQRCQIYYYDTSDNYLMDVCIIKSIVILKIIIIQIMPIKFNINQKSFDMLKRMIKINGFVEVL